MMRKIEDRKKDFKKTDRQLMILKCCPTCKDFFSTCLIFEVYGPTWGMEEIHMNVTKLYVIKNTVKIEYLTKETKGS